LNIKLINLGNTTNNLTVSKELFMKNHLINYFKFEVIYFFSNGNSSSSMNFKRNSPPSNGSCEINSLNDPTTPLFNISCSNWFDENGIKDYLFYSLFFLLFYIRNKIFFLVQSDDYFKETMIGFSLIPTLQLRLPAGNNKNVSLNINVYIRDQSDCVQEYSIPPFYVYDDSKELENLFQSFKDVKNDLINNSLVKILLTGNQNEIGQILTSTSQQLNKINTNSLNNIVSSMRISIKDVRCSSSGP
jgi:hypothetical protein